MGSDSISVEIYLINCCYAEITKATEQKDKSGKFGVHLQNE